MGVRTGIEARRDIAFALRFAMPQDSADIQPEREELVFFESFRKETIAALSKEEWPCRSRWLCGYLRTRRIQPPSDKPARALSMAIARANAMRAEKPDALLST
jgi:hypothetical protein